MIIELLNIEILFEFYYSILIILEIRKYEINKAEYIILNNNESFFFYF